MKIMSVNEMKNEARRIATQTGRSEYVVFDELYERNQKLMCERQERGSVHVRPAEGKQAVSETVLKMFDATPASGGAVDADGNQCVPERKFCRNRRGNADERTPTRKTERGRQAFEVLKALIAKPDGYTDPELVENRIGGTDGPRRRRDLRARFGIDFTKVDTGITRWKLTDISHAKRVLAAGAAVEKEL